MQNQDGQLLTDILNWSYHHGFQGHTPSLMQELGKTRSEITAALHLLVNAGHMHWIANDTTAMTDRGMLETERLGKVQVHIVSLRHRAVQAWNAEVQASQGGSDEALNFWSEGIRRDKELEAMFSCLKNALL